MGRGLATELLLRKDGGYAEYILRTRGLAWAWRYACVQEVNFGSRLAAVLATARSGHDLGDIQLVGRQHLEYVIRVYECGCRDLGENGRLYAVLLGWTALLSWHNIVSGWWSSRHRGCNGVCRSSESCGEDYVQLCALVYTGCTR